MWWWGWHAVLGGLRSATKLLALSSDHSARIWLGSAEASRAVHASIFLLVLNQPTHLPTGTTLQRTAAVPVQHHPPVGGAGAPQEQEPGGDRGAAGLPAEPV